MKAVYYLGDFNEIELAGDEVEWTAFALCLEQGTCEIDCKITDDPSPYSSCIHKIFLTTLPGKKVCFKIDRQSNMLVTGDLELLQILSSTVANFARDFKPGDHIHIDYQGPDHFVGRDSIPVVLAHT